MIDSLLNLLFRCPHRRLTRPVSPVSKPGEPQPQSYVVCLDCGKQFAYHVREMRIGKPIDSSQTGSLIRKDEEVVRRRVLRRVLEVAAATALLLGAIVTGKKWVKPKDGSSGAGGHKP
jgi:hypothetical protein